MEGGDAPPLPSGFAEPSSPLSSVAYAGTLPASAAMLAAMTIRDDAPSAHAPTDPSTTPDASMGASFAMAVRTLDTGDLPTPSLLGALPSASKAGAQPERARTLKTVVDERPPTAPSLSLGRPPRPLGAFLVSYQYEPLGTFWPLGLGANLIGRTGTGRPDLDVGISDTTVSGEQASIEVDASGITVEDRGSRNGTTVNGRPVVAGGKVAVVHGDRIRFGSFETIVVKVPYPAGS
jgi:hypothetical protein